VAKSSRAIRLIGDKELAATLAEFRGNVALRVMRKAIVKGLVPIADAAKRLAPERSGELKRAIIRRVSKKAVGRVMVDPKREITYQGKKYRPSKIAHLVEFGTKAAAAKPFLRPALDSQKSAALAAVTAEARAQLEKEAAKAAAKGKTL
jgi:HK97 gp10 family phage protein